MQTRLFTVDETSVIDAASLLRAGQLVAFPTETVYGLGANALDAAAAASIYAAKGRPSNNPLIVHVSSPEAALAVVAEWPEVAQRLAERFWPGPLTLVLPKRPEIPDVVTGGGPTVAVRMPAHPVALALLRAAGVPVAGPSANRSSRLSPTTAQHVLHDLDGRIAAILDGGPCVGGIESTVLDLVSSPVRILRPGLVGPADLCEVLGYEPALGTAPTAGVLTSPGMLTKHYSPRTPLECVEGGGAGRVAELAAGGARVGWVAAAGALEGSVGEAARIDMPARPREYARLLYATLHNLDDQSLDRIVVDMPPDQRGWMAVRDRLRRAAARE